jgi:protein disulfide-isomerase A6
MRSGHCRQLAPKWRKLADALHGIIRVAAVNCNAQGTLCQNQGVRSYPTIKAFVGGRWEDYSSGDRSASALKDWALSLIPANKINSISKPAHFTDFRQRVSTSTMTKWGSGVLLFTDKPSTGALYKALALRFDGKLAFGVIRSNNKELTRQFNVTSFPTIVAICSGNEGSVIRYDGDMKGTQLAKWLNGFYKGKLCIESLPLDSSTDFTKLKVSQLKQIFKMKGIVCKDCVEKADYVKQLVDSMK